MKIAQSFREQEKALDEFCESGSNWNFDRAVAFDVEVSAIKPLVMGSSSESESDLNSKSSDNNKINIKNFKNKTCLFNPNNKDQKCFLRCVFYLLKKTASKKTSNLGKEL